MLQLALGRFTSMIILVAGFQDLRHSLRLSAEAEVREEEPCERRLNGEVQAPFQGRLSS